MKAEKVLERLRRLDIINENVNNVTQQLSGRKLFNVEDEKTNRVERILFHSNILSERDMNTFNTAPTPQSSKSDKQLTGCIVSRKDGVFKKKTVKKKENIIQHKQSTTEFKSYRDSFQTVRSVNINNMLYTQVEPDDNQLLNNQKELINSQIQQINQRLSTAENNEIDETHNQTIKVLINERDRLNEEISRLDQRLKQFKPIKREIYKQKQDIVDDRDNFEFKWKLLENQLEKNEQFEENNHLDQRSEEIINPEPQNDHLDKSIIDNLMQEVEELMSISNLNQTNTQPGFNYVDKKQYEPILDIIEEEPSMEVSFIQ